MKKIFLISLLSLLIVSCKTSKHAGCDAYSSVKLEESMYTLEMVRINQSKDAKYISENWSKEEIEYFKNNFVYQTVIINGDTLK
jgi:uncharacterized protein YcfL